jgi:hypothetical protein
VFRHKAYALRRFARTDEGALFGAIFALLVAGIVAAILLPTHDAHRAVGRERGSLVAPPSDSEFSDLLAAPADPSLALGGSEPTGPSPQPSPPSPRGTPPPKIPSAPQPPPPPPDDGLLPDLPIIPPPPPLLRGLALAELMRGPR